MFAFKFRTYLSIILLASLLTPVSTPVQARDVTVSDVKFSWSDKVYAPQNSTEKEFLTVTYQNNSVNDFWFFSLTTQEPSGNPFTILGAARGVKAGEKGEMKVPLSYLQFLNLRGSVDYGITLCTRVGLTDPETCLTSKLTFTNEKLKFIETPEPIEDKSCSTGGTCKIGEVGPGGGVIVYVASSPQSWGDYIEAAPKGWYLNRPDPQVQGYCSKKIPDSVNLGSRIGEGLKNSLALRKLCPSGVVAEAMAYNGNSLIDWFLPSISEMGEMYYASKSIGLGNDFGDDYWSSTVLEYGYIKILYYDGRLNFNFRNEDTAKIRPIRYGKLKNQAMSGVKTSKSITCIKGKTTKKVTAINPKCPVGYKKK